MKFQGLELKVGDRIKCIAVNTSYESCISYDKTYTITKIEQDCRLYITCDIGENHWLTDNNDYRFVKVCGTEKKDFSYLFLNAI